MVPPGRYPEDRHEEGALNTWGISVIYAGRFVKSMIKPPWEESMAVI
jgi:hypothetical protein